MECFHPQPLQVKQVCISKWNFIKTFIAWVTPTTERQILDPFWGLCSTFWGDLKSTMHPNQCTPWGGVLFSVHNSRQKTGTWFRMNEQRNVLEDAWDFYSWFYLICPRTRGLFFVLFMFESNGTSKNCKKIEQKREDVNYNVKQFSSSASVLYFCPQ